MNTEKFFKNKVISILLALLCVALWGTAFPVIKKCYIIFSIAQADYGSKILFAGNRFFIAGVLVLIAGIFMEKGFLFPKKRDLLPLGMLGFLQIFLQYLCSYIGLSNTTGTKTSVITALGSFLVVLTAPLFFKKDTLNFKKIFGCVLGFAGVIIINLGGITEGSFSFMGEGMVILSTVAATAGSIYCKKITPSRNPTAISAYHLLFGGLGLIIVGLAFGGCLDFTSITLYLFLIYLGVVSGVSFTIWTALLKYNPVSRILIFNLLIPVFGTVWSGILLGEAIFTTTNFLSVILISAGITLVNIQTKRDKQREVNNG